MAIGNGVVTREKVCPICGAAFAASGLGSGKRVYCSDSCSREAINRRALDAYRADPDRARQKARETMRQVRRTRPEILRDRELRATYGITLADYESMRAAQGNRCAICRRECPSGRRLAVDHDHTTNRVRGLLCMNCNNGVGRFRDDPALLAAAIDYLRGH